MSNRIATLITTRLKANRLALTDTQHIESSLKVGVYTLALSAGGVIIVKLKDKVIANIKEGNTLAILRSGFDLGSNILITLAAGYFLFQEDKKNRARFKELLKTVREENARNS